MPDVEVKINSMYPPGASGGIRAYASATVDGCLGIRGIKVVEGGRDGLFVSMPSRKTENGYKEICFPVPKSSGSSSIRRCWIPAGRSHEPPGSHRKPHQSIPAAHVMGGENAIKNL